MVFAWLIDGPSVSRSQGRREQNGLRSERGKEEGQAGRWTPVSPLRPVVVVVVLSLFVFNSILSFISGICDCLVCPFQPVFFVFVVSVLVLVLSLLSVRCLRLVLWVFGGLELDLNSLPRGIWVYCSIWVGNPILNVGCTMRTQVAKYMLFFCRVPTVSAYAVQSLLIILCQENTWPPLTNLVMVVLHKFSRARAMSSTAISKPRKNALCRLRTTSSSRERVLVLSPGPSLIIGCWLSGSSLALMLISDE